MPDTQVVSPQMTSPSADGLMPEAKGVGLRSVTKKYGNFTAVQDLTLDIPPGSYCCLLGPSGCGKTTTMRMIAGHEDISAGDVYIGDTRVNDLPATQRNTAMMFQNYALFPHKTVWNNIDFGLKMRSLGIDERRRRVGEILEIVGLTQFSDRKPAQLSGGQQQRVALARALVTRPQVLMLDEPLSALDESLRVKTRGELRKLQRQFGMTFIQVTHNQDEAYSLSDQIVVMDHGRVDQVGTPAEIFSQPLSKFVASFTGDNNIFPGNRHQRGARYPGPADSARRTEPRYSAVPG
jgi:putative spermidine/putrescine transport system ATP-binding protein